MDKYDNTNIDLETAIFKVSSLLIIFCFFVATLFSSPFDNFDYESKFIHHFIFGQEESSKWGLVAFFA